MYRLFHSNLRIRETYSPICTRKARSPLWDGAILLPDSSFCRKVIPKENRAAKGIDLCMDIFSCKHINQIRSLERLSKRREAWIVYRKKKNPSGIEKNSCHPHPAQNLLN